MEIVRTLDAGQWRTFVDSHPESNVFHTPDVFEVFANVKGHQPELWAVLDKGEVLALLLPVQITLSTPLRLLTTRSISYGGLLYSPNCDGILAAQQLLKEYVEQAGRVALFSEFRNLYDQGPLKSIYQNCGFTYEKHLNYLIDLTGSPSEVLQRIGSRTRKNIRRRLRRSDVIVREANDLVDVATCYKLIMRSYDRAHVPLADWSLFKAAYELLTPKNMLRFYLAYMGDVPVAASAELLHKNTLYGWYSGVERAYGEYTPGDILMWHVLHWGSENGYHTYDFGGAGKPGQKSGVRDFKAKFGGELVEYGRFTITHAPIRTRLSKLGYFVYQQLPWLWPDRHGDQKLAKH